jgi:hypothetical protein
MEAFMKTVRCSVDRIEGELAVLISDEDLVFHLNAKKYGLSVNDVIDLVTDGEKAVSVTKREDIASERYESNKSRLSALFAKSKKK